MGEKKRFQPEDMVALRAPLAGLILKATALRPEAEREGSRRGGEGDRALRATVKGE